MRKSYEFAEIICWRCAVKNLKPMEDACGQEIWAYFKGERSFEIVEREDGYVDVSGGAPFYFSAYDD